VSVAVMFGQCCLAQFASRDQHGLTLIATVEWKRFVLLQKGRLVQDGASSRSPVGLLNSFE
jgi:hypothetical protein